MAKEAQTDRYFGYDKQTEWEAYRPSLFGPQTNSTKQSYSMIEEIMYNRPNRITSKENREYFKRLREKYEIKHNPKLYKEIKSEKSESLSQFWHQYSNQLEFKNSHWKENQPVEHKVCNEEISIGKALKFLPCLPFCLAIPSSSSQNDGLMASQRSYSNALQSKCAESQKNEQEKSMNFAMNLRTCANPWASSRKSQGSRSPYRGISARRKNRDESKTEQNSHRDENIQPKIFSIEMLESAVKASKKVGTTLFYQHFDPYPYLEPEANKWMNANKNSHP